jgi:hypothetical protein
MSIDEVKTPLHKRPLCYICRNSQPDSPKILKYDARRRQQPGCISRSVGQIRRLPRSSTPGATDDFGPLHGPDQSNGGHPRCGDDRPRPAEGRDHRTWNDYSKFDYLPDGRITGLRDVFTSFNEPSRPIPAEVSALTGAVQTLHLTTNGAESRHGDTVSASTALLRLPRAC